MRDMEKACTKCGEVKLLEDFFVDNSIKSGRRPSCKECHNADQKKHYAENRAKIAARKKKYYADNPEKYAAKDAKRRAAKLERIPSWSNDNDLKAIRKIYARCKKINKLTGIPHEVDHVIPMQGENISGLHHSTNLAIIPAALNASKNNKWEFQEVYYG